MRSRSVAAAVAAVVITAGPSLAVTTTTVTFRQGENGYSGVAERLITDRQARNVGGPTQRNGALVSQYFVDGRTGLTNFASPDEQALIRFDNIFGSGPGQIPVGAFILDAGLTLTTSAVGNAETGGPYGVAGLLQGFDPDTTNYLDLTDTNIANGIGRGPDYRDSNVNGPLATRAVGGWGNQQQNDVGTANVRPLVQGWANNPATNLGMTVQAGFQGTTDGWAPHTSGVADITRRPKLSVTYTTDPIEVKTFQNLTGGYQGTRMAHVNGPIPNAPDPLLTQFTDDGASISQAFLDGEGPTQPDSPDTFALVQFQNVFGTNPDQVDPTVPIAKAWMVITTGETSGAARTAGTYSVHAMLRDWNTTQLRSDFGAIPGLQESEGEISAALASATGIITGQEAWFDVTSHLEAVRTGQGVDFGFAILANTADGWQIHFTGSEVESARPRLVVASVIPEPASLSILLAGALALRRRR